MLIQSCRIHGRFFKSLGECRPAKAQSASRPGNPSKLVLGRYDDRMIAPAATKEKEIGSSREGHCISVERPLGYAQNY
jgi:hypothetical protein